MEMDVGFKKIFSIASLGVIGLMTTTQSFASTVNVNLSEEHQVIRGFGGMVHQSWQGNGGLNESDAKLAFGTGDGQIGLNTLRIPVNKNSSDFGKEVAAAKLAKKYAGDDFILYATPWDSPYAGGNAHVSSGNYQNYTNHLNSFAEYMKNQGVPLYAISFQNEPDWCGTWTCWTADEIYNYTKNYGNQLRKHGTKVISAESFAYRKNLYDKVLNDANALKNMDILGVHFYASEANTPNSFFEYALADQKKVERWMTEHYTESQGSANYWRTVMTTGDQANASKRDTVRALDVGYEIHRGLAVGNFSQYTWWYIRRCYGLIMEKDFGNKLSIPQNEIGKVSKRGYVLSQFARFIRPGAIRVGATINPESNLYASAYKSADGDSTIVVLVNRDYKNSKTVTVNVPNSTIESFHVYTTSEAKNAKYEGEVEAKNGSVTITMESGASNKDCIVTLVGVGPQIVAPQEPFGGKAATLPGKIEVENYDITGSGKGNNSYYDMDSENKGKVYREDAVDIEEIKCDDDASSKCYGIGYTQAGEWLEYTVNVATAGEYYLTLRAAAGGNSGSVQLSVDEKAITDTIAIPQTAENDWSIYKNINAGKIKLDAGKHILRLAITGSYANIDWINIGEEIKEPEEKNDNKEEKAAIKNINMHLAQSIGTYVLFDLNGNTLGQVKATGIADAQRIAKNIVQSSGLYCIKSLATGTTYKFINTK